MADPQAQNVQLSQLGAVDFSGANLEDLDLSEVTFHTDWEPDATGVRRPVFTNARLARTDFRRRALGGVRFDGADLTDAVFTGAELQTHIYLFAHEVLTPIVLDLSRANLTGAHFERATLAGVRLDEANLEDADFSAARFETVQRYNPLDLQTMTIPVSLLDAGLEGASLECVQVAPETRFDGVSWSGTTCPEARCARPQPAAPALTVSGESALFYLWFPF